MMLATCVAIERIILLRSDRSTHSRELVQEKLEGMSIYRKKIELCEWWWQIKAIVLLLASTLQFLFLELRYILYRS